MKDYSKEELQELYEELPKDLQEALFSKEIGKKIQEFCYENNILDQDFINGILKKIAYVFLGLLNPNDFKKELKGHEAINDRINNEIFLELKDSLEAFYDIKLKFKKIVPKKKKTKEIKNKDKYLEPIE